MANQVEITEGRLRSDDGERIPQLDAFEAARLESAGANIDQSDAETENERWRVAARTAPVDPTWFRGMGGDWTDRTLTPNDTAWTVGSDIFVGTTLDDDDLYEGSVLPNRSALMVEDPPGTFERQVFLDGNSGNWLPHPPNGSDEHYWPIAVHPDPGNVDRIMVGCWRVESATSPGAPWGTLLDTTMLSLSLGFGGAVASTFHVEHGPGGPFILKWWSDATHTYGLWADFSPPYSPGDATVPIYGVGPDISDHHTKVLMSRSTNADFDVVANLTWWNGADWVSGASNAVPLIDERGIDIRGDADITQAPDGSYRIVGHQLVDRCLDVYRSDVITGPYERYVRVPIPGMGARVHGGVQIGQLPHFCEDLTAPAEHVLVCVALNTLGTTGTHEGRNIRRYSPQHVAVPFYA